jgi:glyoxylase-like metal-dependent hydrolase (beta-lactamase superfamily II)
MDYRIISIGALSRHELWQEKTPPRTPHATTTLVRSGEMTMLVDPGLPGPAVNARLNERAGLTAEDVNTVFLTNFRPAHRAGLGAFEHSTWYIGEEERERVGRQLIARFEQEDDNQIRRLIEQDIAVLQRCKPAPDKLAPQVDLFPLPGFTPGSCGLLLTLTNATVLIAGDAVATLEHLENGRVLRGAFDIAKAQESLSEAVEIADVIVPGHDNIMLNPVRRRF